MNRRTYRTVQKYYYDYQCKRTLEIECWQTQTNTKQPSVSGANNHKQHHMSTIKKQ